MKVISLLQPWASLVVLGHKKIETRSWNTTYRGPLLIHASKKEFRPVKGMEKLMENMLACGFFDQVKHIPYGAIIGFVNLNDTAPTEQFNYFRANFRPSFCDFKNSGVRNWNQEYAFGDYSPNRYGWLLSDPFEFDKPIPCNGSLGLWEYNDWIPVKMATK